MMIQEVGVDVVAKRVLRVKVRPDYEPLFALLYGLCQDGELRDWLEHLEAKKGNCEIEADTRQARAVVKTLPQMSHNVVTSAAERISPASEQHPDLQVVSGNLAYLEKREAQMQYPLFQAQGWPIGSGMVESGNKLVIEARLKCSGMHWKDELSARWSPFAIFCAAIAGKKNGLKLLPNCDWIPPSAEEISIFPETKILILEWRLDPL